MVLRHERPVRVRDVLAFLAVGLAVLLQLSQPREVRDLLLRDLQRGPLRLFLFRFRFLFRFLSVFPFFFLVLSMRASGWSLSSTRAPEFNGFACPVSWNTGRRSVRFSCQRSRFGKYPPSRRRVREADALAGVAANSVSLSAGGHMSPHVLREDFHGVSLTLSSTFFSRR